jgi:hypothetical protein
MNFTKKIISIVLVASMAFPSLAIAEGITKPAATVTANIVPLPPPPVPSSEPDPGAATSPLRKGQPAPFTGVLLSPAAVASIIAEFKSFDGKIALEVDKAKKDAAASCDFTMKEAATACTTDKKILTAAIEARDSRINLLETDLKKTVDSMPSRTIWFGLGVVGGIVLTVATVYVVSQATK